MRQLPFWIQKADFHTTDFEAEDVDTMINIIKDYDWHKEHIIQQNLLAARQDYCPSGIGIVDNDHEAILHICPLVRVDHEPQKYQCHLHRTVWARAFALVPFPRTRSMTCDDFELQQIVTLLQRLFRGDIASCENFFAAQLAPEVSHGQSRTHENPAMIY